MSDKFRKLKMENKPQSIINNNQISIFYSLLLCKYSGIEYLRGEEE